MGCMLPHHEWNARLPPRDIVEEDGAWKVSKVLDLCDPRHRTVQCVNDVSLLSRDGDMPMRRTMSRAF